MRRLDLHHAERIEQREWIERRLVGHVQSGQLSRLRLLVHSVLQIRSVVWMRWVASLQLTGVALGPQLSAVRTSGPAFAPRRGHRASVAHSLCVLRVLRVSISPVNDEPPQQTALR
jgi:hypothetical protein